MTLPDPRDAERPRDLYGEIRDAYAAYVEAETAQGSTRLYPRSCFEAGYLAAQPKRPSVEEVARVIGKYDWPHATELEKERWVEKNWGDHVSLARAILALFESPAHDR